MALFTSWRPSQVIEKTPDGWCEGILNGNKGTFPASFVLEVQPPRTKEEIRQLIKMVNLKKKSPDIELETVKEEEPVPPKKSGVGVFGDGQRCASGVGVFGDGAEVCRWCGCVW